TANVAGKFAYTANGNAVTATTVLPAGSYTMGVTFTPTASKDYTTATASVSLTVNPINTTTTITKASAASRTAPLALTVSFTVANGLGTKYATGSVTVTASSGETCTATLASGKGSCVLTTAVAESGTLTAVYAGDSNNNGSTSSAFSFTD
ncbi:MAG: Ig-like domain repeat protein, partial [Terriglobales bacterium]